MGVPLNPQLLASLQAMQQGGPAPMAGAPSSTPGLPPPQASSVGDDSAGMGGGMPTTQAPAGGQDRKSVV